MGYCPFSIWCRNTVVVSRHERPRRERQALLCSQPRTCARVGACLGRPVAASLLGCSVVTKILTPRQDLVVRCQDTVLVSRQGRAYGRCRDKRKPSARDRRVLSRHRISSVATENSLSRQALQCFLSRQTYQGLLSRQSFPCRDTVCTAPCRDRVSCVTTGRGFGRVEVSRATVRNVCTTTCSDRALCM